MGLSGSMSGFLEVQVLLSHLWEKENEEKKEREREKRKKKKSSGGSKPVRLVLLVFLSVKWERVFGGIGFTFLPF